MSAFAAAAHAVAGIYGERDHVPVAQHGDARVVAAYELGIAQLAELEHGLLLHLPLDPVTAPGQAYVGALEPLAGFPFGLGAAVIVPEQHDVSVALAHDALIDLVDRISDLPRIIRDNGRRIINIPR